MPKIEDITAYDDTRKSYTFEVYPIGTNFNPVAGVYMFTASSTQQNGTREYTPIYIGETHSFRDRPLNSNHPKWEEALIWGFDHICVHVNANSRVLIQNKLIDAYNPPLNKT